MFDSLRAIDVFIAAKRLEGVARRTPLARAAALSDRARGDVYLKLESAQRTGSFKLRGAFNALASLPPAARERGVVAASAGNHGLGVAYAARHFAAPATVFVPSTAPRVKRDGIAALGAHVDASAPTYDAAHELAIAYARERGATYVDPCADPMVIAGQGTVGLEILTELPEVAAIVVPVGGAGLLGGIASVVRRVAPHVRIVGAQGDLTPAMARALAAGRVVEVPVVPTLADGLAGQIDEVALDIGRHALDDLVLVGEDEIAAAIAWLARAAGETVEGAGAVGPAAVLSGRLASLPSPAVLVVSGGNIDPARHAEVLARYPAGEEAGRAQQHAAAP